MSHRLIVGAAEAGGYLTTGGGNMDAEWKNKLYFGDSLDILR